MRTVSVEEADVLATADYAVAWRFRVANADGTMVDLTDWLISAEVTSNDGQPFDTANFTLARSHDGQSLAPLMEGSTLNRDDADAYAPLLYKNRTVDLAVKCYPHGDDPDDWDWKEIYKGRVLDPSLGDLQAPITLSTGCYLGAGLTDVWIKDEEARGADDGSKTLEETIQDVLDGRLGAAFLTLNTPVATGAVVSPAYLQKREPLLTACRTLAGSRFLRPRHDGADVLRLTLITPDRSGSDPVVWTFGPEHRETRSLVEAGADIRTQLVLSFKDAATGERIEAEYTNDAMIAALGGSPWGELTMFITEADDSPVNSQAKADEFGEDVVADASQGSASVEIEVPLFWPAQLMDRHTLEANGHHFDTDQDMAVTQVRHLISRDRQYTAIQYVGAPRAMGPDAWQTRGLGSGKIAPRILTFTLSHTAGTPTGTVSVTAASFNSAVRRYEVYARLGAAPVTAEGQPDGTYRKAKLVPGDTLPSWTVGTNGTLYWRVRAYDEAGNYSDKSGTLAITGIPGDGAGGTAPTVQPTLVRIRPGDVGVGVQDVEIVWTNSVTSLGGEVDWLVNGVIVDGDTFAAGDTSVAARSYTIGQTAQAYVRYTSGGNDGPNTASNAFVVNGAA